MDSPWLAGKLMILPLLAACWLLDILTSQRLRTHHPAAWDSLGRPEMLANRRFRAEWRFFVFSWSGEHATLGDPQLAALIWSYRVVALLALLDLVLILAIGATRLR